MKIIQKFENGPTLLEPDVFNDDRGCFFESFNEIEFQKLIPESNKFVQDNQSVSKKWVIRGMHFQKGEFAQSKLVRVTRGSILDVVVDIREDSENYGKVYSAFLSDENNRQFFIPRGFAHGFISFEDNTILQYKCDNYYNKESEGSYNWKSIDFDWNKYLQGERPILSEKDAKAPCFNKI